MTTPSSGSDAADRERELVEWAASFGPFLSERAANHDAEGSWVGESFCRLRDAGFLALAVPTEFGGMGATIRQTAMVMREVARHCGSTSLALSMHQHLTAAGAWRYRRGAPGAAEMLRRIADERIVVASTGASDFTRPRGTAVRVDGGYRVRGRKRFVSQSPVATLLATMFPIDDPDGGQRVLNVTVPLAATGVTIADNWNTMGMRGTASNDIVFDDVFVPDQYIIAERPYGVIDVPLRVASIVAASIISAVYLGVAESAATAAVDAVAGTDRAGDPLTQRTAGLMLTRLRIASWALDGALGAGEDFQPSMETMAAVMTSKTEVARAGIAVCDLAMDLAGGSAFYRGSVIERAYRDIRGAKFHQLQPEASLLLTGKLALDLPCDDF